MLGASMALAGCGGRQDRFASGDWELKSWLEVKGRSGQFEPQTHSAKLSPQVADAGVHAAMFSEFYHGEKGQNVVFEGGVISGHFDQQAVAPFPEHQQAVSGTYAAESFDMRITMPVIAGVQSYQVVTGKHIGGE